MLVTETRACSECLHFKNHITGFPTCKKKLMGVTANMHVTYKAEEGSCFEVKGIDSTELLSE
jgi:hypothetical protein